MKLRPRDIPMGLHRFAEDLAESDVFQAAQALSYRQVTRGRANALLRMFGELVLPSRGQQVSVEDATLLIMHQLTINRVPPKLPRGLKRKVLWTLIKFIRWLA